MAVEMLRALNAILQQRLWYQFDAPAESSFKELLLAMRTL
jgi:hypothetical protein